MDLRRGSEWRRWDLHVHTPFSALNNEFGSDVSAYAARLFAAALERDIAAIGVTDYFAIDGYKALRDVTSSEDVLEEMLGGGERATRAREILLLPNVELRSTVIIRAPDGSDSRVNFHLIFDEALDPGMLEEQFLHRLEFTAQSNPSSRDERWALTPGNLEDLGRRLKEEHERFSDLSDLRVGMMNAVIDHEDVTRVLEDQQSRFAGRYVFVAVADEDLSDVSWDGQGHLARKIFLQKAHMLFSGNRGTRDFGLGRKHASVDDFVREFRSLKPCIHGSDAHDYDSLFAPAQDRQLWIKANPTFQGLRQLIFEPESRVYIGEEPQAVSRVKEKATRYLDSIRFRRSQYAPQDAQWFNGEMPFHPGLIAVIGNKGSGKSALADVLGLVGDTRNAGHFSFLTRDRFLAPRSGLGPHFEAELRWRSGETRARRLDARVEETAAESVKYIPQHYLETICSEFLDAEGSQFEDELMEVIFSHVGDAERLGKRSLRELISYLTDETEKLIRQLQSQLNDVNAEILTVEAELSPEFRKSIEAQLAQREADLAAHDKAQPEAVPAPGDQADIEEASAQAETELAELVAEIESLDHALTEAKSSQSDSAQQLAAAKRLVSRIENLARQIDSFHGESASDAAAVGVDTREVVRLVVDTAPIDLVVTEATEARTSADRALSNEEGSIARRRAEFAAKTDAVRARLNEPARRHQRYLQMHAAWQKRRDEIIGTPDNADSIEGLKAERARIDTLPSRLTGLLQGRADVVSAIFAEKIKLLAEYEILYSPVQRFIDEHPVSQAQPDLQFSAAVAVNGFASEFLQMIHQGRRGNFQGEVEGRDLVNELLAAADFATQEGVSAFLGSVEEALRAYRRDGTPLRLDDQVRQDWTAHDLITYLYGLEYLRPRFELKWQGKPLEQLSPGERGNLLLVFYLLIDRRDVPLVIDQPEENLDNLSIWTTLVPALKYAKNERQIVIVTHNPNLAVVCDAEQIVHARLDKSDGNRVTYISGAIEDPVITQLVVDVLEGTKPAFDIRDAKYEILDRVQLTTD